MTSFNDFNFANLLLISLDKMGINTPTPIQAAAIPLALEGHDILASSQTGSGKTLAFLLPLITNLQNNPESTALVLAPTRELALQVRNNLVQLAGKTSFMKSALLIGGEPMPPQFRQLQGKPRVIIGTPGRIHDHLQRRSLNLSKAHFLVLDETDRMLDMGFSVQLDAIFQYLPSTRQTFMFSATFPPNIVNLSRKYLKDAKRITIESTPQSMPKIRQEVIYTSSAEKFPKLLKELEKREGSIIVFVKTKINAENISKKLNEGFHQSSAMHGDLNQRKRERILKDFRNEKSRIMIATDVAARGLDIPHIKHVINYDLPQCPEDFIHRIGRTGRAGATGSALSFVMPADNQKWRNINRLMNIDVALPPVKKEKGSLGAAAPQPRARKTSASPARPFKSDRFKQVESLKKTEGFKKSEDYKPWKKTSAKPKSDFRKGFSKAARG